MAGNGCRRVARVLLVDDKEPFLRYWQRQLRELTIESSSARSIDQALEVARARTHQLAIVDLFLEETQESGLVLIEKLRALDDSMAIMLVSADLPERHALYAMHIGALWALPKPFEWSEVIAVAEGMKPPLPSLEEHATDFDTRSRTTLERTLQATSGNQTRAAERLQIPRNTLRRKCEKLGINAWRPPEDVD
jgi:two-component system, response regulator RegA